VRFLIYNFISLRSQGSSDCSAEFCIPRTKFAGLFHAPNATRRIVSSPRAASGNVSRSNRAPPLPSAGLPFLNAPPQIVVRYERQTCSEIKARGTEHEWKCLLLDSSPPVAGLIRFPEANHFSMLARSYLQRQRNVASGTARGGTVAVERAKLREAVDCNHRISHDFHGDVPVRRQVAG